MLVADLRNRISAVIGMISWEPPKHVVEALVSPKSKYRSRAGRFGSVPLV